MTSCRTSRRWGRTRVVGRFYERDNGRKNKERVLRTRRREKRTLPCLECYRKRKPPQCVPDSCFCFQTDVGTGIVTGVLQPRLPVGRRHWIMMLVVMGRGGEGGDEGGEEGRRTCRTFSTKVPTLGTACLPNWYTRFGRKVMPRATPQNKSWKIITLWL